METAIFILFSERQQFLLGLTKTFKCQSVMPSTCRCLELYSCMMTKFSYRTQENSSPQVNLCVEWNLEFLTARGHVKGTGVLLGKHSKSKGCKKKKTSQDCQHLTSKCLICEENILSFPKHHELTMLLHLGGDFCPENITLLD
ncbi:uncharacterized protein LOC143841024 isoform X2 [Paroedura picta]|uniref:uncharacterized protein LOC143841024 isoform X2 n=1 Tax=Paroedura picta TaxID=143630 RepID=UPI004055FB12